MAIREEAHRASVRLEFPLIAEKLQETLGQRLTAYAVGVRDPKAIGKYARAETKPREETQARLRELYRITQQLLSRETAETVRAWMIGSNPQLNDKAPIELLHEESSQPVARAAQLEAGEPLAPSARTAFQSVDQAAQTFIGAAA